MKLDDNTIIKITPKGIAAVELIAHELLDSLDDQRFHEFWEDFEIIMNENGYIIQEVEN